MNIYQIIPDPDKFNYLEAREKDYATLDRFVGRSLRAEWIPINLRFDTSVGKYGDFPSLRHGIPIFSERAWNILGPALFGSVEALPVIAKGGNYFAINVIDVVDCLDLEKAVLDKISPTIIFVDSYFFKETFLRGKLVFKIPETCDSEVYATEAFRKLVLDNNLKGLIFKLLSPQVAEVATASSGVDYSKEAKKPNTRQQRSKSPSAKETIADADIDQIEAALSVKLPIHYRQFMLKYPIALKKAKFTYNNEPASASFIFDDPQQVIEHNQTIREPGLLVVNSEQEPWPDDMLIIGADGGGGYWCIRLSDRSKAVWFFEHEEGVFKKHCKTLQDHENYAIKSVDEVNRNET